MLGFWIIAATSAVVAIAVIGRALIVGSGSAAADTAAYDVQVYRDQLAELDRDVARGVIGAAEADRARLETSRRLLEADRQAQARSAAASAPRALTLSALALSAAVIFGGGMWLYSRIGAIVENPDAPAFALPAVMPDLPLATRKADAEAALATRSAQAELEARLPDWAGPPPQLPADYLTMIDQLRAAVEKRPDDLDGQLLLAQHEATLGNFRAAHRAMARVIEIKGDAASADDYTQYAELMILAVQGGVSPEAETALKLALEADPQNGIALYYLGLMYAQNGRPDLAFAIWRDLLEGAQPGDPWVAPIRGQIEQLAFMAGVDYTPPAATAAPAIAGPSQEDVEAAAEMSDADRGAMIQDMVNRLMDRLATEGGTPEEWAQLIGALTILGDTERARSIWGEAQSVFGNVPQARALIDQTARNAGLEDPVAFDPAAEPAPAAPDDGDGAAPAPDTAPDTAPDAAPDAALPGPTADDIAAAAEMSDEDRTSMIDGMVTRLSDELATAGGPPEKWVMLLKSLDQLGETERARTVWSEAQTYFAQDPDGLAAVRPTAIDLGLAN